MENKVKQFSEKIAGFETKKTRKGVFLRQFLRDNLQIHRLTQHKRQELNDLFEKYKIKIKYFVGNEYFNWSTDDIDRKVIFMFDENLSHSRNSVTVETTARQTIKIADGTNGIQPYPHQRNALYALDKFYTTNKKTKGILVLPTGAGKTMVAVQWLLRNVIDKNRKLIWLAHRHELLNQAKETFIKNCYKQYLPNRKEIVINIISGDETHNKSLKINENDDIIIASKDSLRIGKKYLNDNFLSKNKDVFLVIDEAHHAVAETYVNLINEIEQKSDNFKLLGLTATPFRTAEKEKSFLSKVFTDDIIYSDDLNNLIIQKILAKPIIEQVETGEHLQKDKDFTQRDLNHILQQFNLPENIKADIATRPHRNRKIVETYDKNKHGKTIIFALNRNHAITLKELFNNSGYKSEFIISGTVSELGINTSKNNKLAIEKFRKSELDILINVNILTEGTDLPQAESVFLTRPTNSKIMLTQMIGRVLRGPKAGGTETANIISFIDEWDGLVSWISPKELLSDENEIFFQTSEHEFQRLEYISIQLIQQFAQLLDTSINTSDLKSLPAIQRIPVGWYVVDIERHINNDETESINRKIMVYGNQFASFQELEKDMQDLYTIVDVDKNRKLDNHERKFMLGKINEKYFDNITQNIPQIKDSDLKLFIEYYDQKKQTPPYFTFTERDKIDISKLAREIIEKDLRRSDEKELINKTWGQETEKTIWKVFFDKFEYFENELHVEMNKILYPEKFKQEIELPEIENYAEILPDIELYKWPQPYQQEMRDKIFEKHNIPKKERSKYQIDHIKPFSKGGKTEESNLQPLTRKENMRKSDNIIID
ncbi:MAG: DEAD/DEAH box helicase family protein [Bacteroidales bacterium]|nr:DEAD/DEAH box helicase family protein [Bacteroidales bacterium]